ncbi:DUF1109 domain-containing protein [Paraburkholderia sp.]|uniref:DUF1109 domain-containing protein n=1 Tax=Paraburkholderia sp. TaxID=1926495 RepID=UPI003D6E5C86
MKTDALISLLATGATPVKRHAVSRRLAPALLIGALGAALIAVFGYGVRPDIGTMLVTPLFWAKLALPFCLAVAALVLTAQLSRPGVAVGRAWAGVAAPVAAVWLAALVLLWLAPADSRAALVFGHTWHSCPFNIALLSVPGCIATFAAMRGLAPTRLRLAGAAAGLLSGSVATIAYCLHCPEMAVSFWAVWYVLGIGLPTVAGALAGPRLLRW